MLDSGDPAVVVASSAYNMEHPSRPRVARTLVDRYAVMRTDRTPITVWEVGLDNTSVVDGFPRPDAGAFRSQLRH